MGYMGLIDPSFSNELAFLWDKPLTQILPGSQGQMMLELTPYLLVAMASAEVTAPSMRILLTTVSS